MVKLSLCPCCGPDLREILDAVARDIAAEELLETPPHMTAYLFEVKNRAAAFRFTVTSSSQRPSTYRRARAQRGSPAIYWFSAGTELWRLLWREQYSRGVRERQSVHDPVDELELQSVWYPRFGELVDATRSFIDEDYTREQFRFEVDNLVSHTARELRADLPLDVGLRYRLYRSRTWLEP